MGIKLLNELLFLPLDIPCPPKEVIKELNKISYNDMVYQDYINCFYIPVVSYDKKTKKSSWNNNLLTIYEYLKKYVFPWTGVSKTVILTPKQGENMNHHNDCSLDKFHTIQHKFRFVIQGNTNDLKFLTNNDSVCPPNINTPFIMDGSWPHKMTSTSEEKRYVLALGYPWEPKSSDIKYISLLEKSYKKYKQYYMSNKNLHLPKDYKKLFENGF